MGMLRVMSRHGDDRLTWDSQKAETRDPEAMAAIKEVQRIFDEAIKENGATAFEIEPGKPAKLVKNFNRDAAQIVIVPCVVGG